MTKKLTRRLGTVLLCLFISISYNSSAQSSDFIDISEVVDQSGNYSYNYAVDLIKLQAEYPLDSSHPDAKYTFFWSFGDGHYSFEDAPSHSYEDSDDVTVKLIATPRYSPTTPPPPDEEELTATKGNPPPANTDPMLLLDRQPRPAFGTLNIINYKNITSSTINDAELRLYFMDEYFDYIDFDAFNDESYNGYTLDNSYLPKYDGYISYSVGSLAPGEQHTLMAELETLIAAMGPVGEPLPELFLKAQLLYTIQSKRGGSQEVIVQEHEIITEATGSWDPNEKLAITDDLFYDLMPQQEWIEYKVNFQNLGIAPAKNVVIHDTISIDFDSTQIRIIDYHHPNIAIHNGFSYSFSSSKRAIRFRFRNINLSGLAQPGISNPAETEGYVVFAVKTKNKTLFAPPVLGVDSCKPYYQFDNVAYITFDKNPAIKTDTASCHLYLSSLASCFDEIPSCSPNIRVVPNPIQNGKIVLSYCDSCTTQTKTSNSLSGITYSLYTSSFSPVNCNLNVTYSNASGNVLSAYPTNACQNIIIQPACLTTGYYYLVVNVNGVLYRFTIVVI